MPRRDKGDGSIPRKRALVSCDRCKVRRARCIRENADEICADCRISGVHCESKLPRKQRVYGSVETLSLRYRALEALVKGLFPEENVQDTNVIFTLASARKIPMPASDDYTPADIFHSTSQRPLPAQQPHLQDYQQTATQARQQSQPLPQVGKHPIRSSSTSSLGSTTKASHHNPFSEVQSHSPQAAELISTRHGVPHYFGPSSSFRLATTIRSLSARCKALQGTYFSKLSRPDSSHYTSASQIPTLGRPTSTNPSDEEYTIPDQVETQSPTRAQQKLPKPKVGADGPWERADSSPIADLLPSRSLADALVSAYFDHVHMFLPLFHRSIFQYQMEATYSRQSEILGQCKDIGWLVCLALVFAFGCEQLHEHDPGQAHTLRLKYLDFAKAYFRKLLTTTSLANVQALMLLNLHHDNLGQKSTSWLLVGVGARMASDTLKVIEKKLTYITQAITMGMHRDGSNKEFDPIERNTRRQVWFSIYILEKILCSVLGRPTVIDDSEMTVRLPDASMLEQQSVSAAFMERTFQISQMSYRMRQRAYFDASTAEERSPPLKVAVSLLRECDEFYSMLPHNLLPDFSPPPPPAQKAKVLLLHLYYYYTRCIVTRDFLIQKVERDISYLENKLPPISEDWDTTFTLSEDCVESAYQSIRCIMAGLEPGSIAYPWFDLFFVFHAVLIVCADFLARPQNQHDSLRDIERKKMVRAMLDHVRGMKKQAPTYSILSRIAVQFADITGVYEQPGNPEGIPSQENDPSPEPRAASVHDSVMSSLVENSDFQEDWFASATANLGLDFFDLNDIPGVMPLHPTDSAYPGYIEPMVNQVDDWTIRTLRGVHTL